MFFFELQCVEGPKVIYHKHFKNSDERCTFTVFWTNWVASLVINSTFDGFSILQQAKKAKSTEKYFLTLCCIEKVDFNMKVGLLGIY